MSDTPTPAPTLTDEQIDGGFDGDGIKLMYESLIQIWAERYGETRAVSDWYAAVIARAKREERERIGRDGDGFHTFAELYEYRMLYNAHAAHGWLAAGVPVVKSWRHSDGEKCFGGEWFIVTAQLPTGQVSNHYGADAWPLFHVPEVKTAPEWDGHQPVDAADRLRAALDALNAGGA